MIRRALGKTQFSSLEAHVAAVLALLISSLWLTCFLVLYKLRGGSKGCWVGEGDGCDRDVGAVPASLQWPAAMRA